MGKFFRNKKEYHEARRLYFLVEELNRIRGQIQKFRKFGYHCACNVNKIEDCFDKIRIKINKIRSENENLNKRTN